MSTLQDKQQYILSKLPKIIGMSQRTQQDKAKSNQNDKLNHDKLRELSKLENNKECADCTSKYTGWTSLPHGIFICINCAQIHRKIGRHISQVKAFNTGTYLWYSDEIKCMELMGNNNANTLYLNGDFLNKVNVDCVPIQRELYIKNKYEYLKWIEVKKDKVSKEINLIEF